MEAGEGVDLATAALPEIIARTPPPAPADWDRVRAEALSVTADTMASIVYTSGTTGPPKGVMLSHGNFLFDLEQCLERLQFRTARQALSVLPLSHVFERLLCYGYFRMGVPVAYGDPHSLRELFRQHKPVVMGCVPRILEKIQEAIEGEVRNQLAWKRRFFSAATRSGRASTNAGEQAPVRHRLLDHVARRAVSASVRRQLGGLRYFVCGGAWLNPAVEEFFRGLGFAVLQGYGLTETSPVIALNGPGGERPGTVGPRLEEVGLRLDESGEILTRGRHVMMGYYRDPEATAKVFRDGWLATGDLGRIDEQGYLAITGRRKDLLVLSTGKNVCPVFTERALERSRFVLHAFAVGHGRRFLAALIVPRRPALEEFARDTGNPARGFEELLSRPEVSSLFRAELETLQAELSPFEQAKRFCFLSEDALLDPQLVTPTQKVRRAVLEERYAEWIDRMYSQIEPAPALIPAGPDVAYGERDLTPRGL